MRLGLQSAEFDLNLRKLRKDSDRKTLAPQRPVKWDGNTRQPHSSDCL